MRNLLELEQSILNDNESLKNGLQVEKINEFQNEIFTSGVSKFQSSVKMSKVVKKSVNYFDSQECKNMMIEEGISWTKEEFFLKLYGWKKSYGYKMLKLSSIHTSKINKFIRKMTELRENGQDTKESSISVENCLKFIRSESGEETTETTTPNPIIFKSFMLFDGVKKTITIKNDGTIKSDLENDEIELMIEKLKEVQISQLPTEN